MTDHRDDSKSIQPAVAANPPEKTVNVAAEDLGCLQSALDDWQRKHNRQLARPQAAAADAQLQHPERRSNEALGQPEAIKRSPYAVRVRLDADVQAARTRAHEAQAALAASQIAAEQLRVANAELSTALDAAEWRLGELEAASTAHRAALLHMQQEHHAQLQRLAELDGLADAHARIEAEHQAQRSALEADLHTAHAQRQHLEQQLAAAQSERSALEANLQQLRTAHADELDAWQRVATQREAELVAARDALAQQLAAEQLQARTTRDDGLDSMTARICELENERSALGLRVDELTALTGQLERECDQLRRNRGSIEETRRLKAHNARLEDKLLELDRQRSEAAQRHSAAVAGYMVELNQRSEALKARGVELQKLTEELTLLRQTCEDAVGDLAAQRCEQDGLDRAPAKLGATPAPAATSALSEPIRPAPPAGPQPSAAPPPTRLAPAKPARQPSRVDTLTGPVTVIHLEDNTTLCDAARDVVARLPDARYMNALDATSPDAPGSRLLVVNLLSRACDPIEAIASFIAADNYHRNVLAYCAEGANGFSFGTADFFAQPIDPDACVARLLESRGTIRGLLVVTDDFGVVAMLRDVLSRMRSAVSAALDLRQVVDLLPMVEPDVVLVDLGLPRGEGLRLVNRLRSDPKMRDLGLAILLAAPGGAGEFRQHALRAARDLPMSPAHLAEALGQRLGVPRSGKPMAHAGAATLA